MKKSMISAPILSTATQNSQPIPTLQVTPARYDAQYDEPRSKAQEELIEQLLLEAVTHFPKHQRTEEEELLESSSDEEEVDFDTDDRHPDPAGYVDNVDDVERRDSNYALVAPAPLNLAKAKPVITPENEIPPPLIPQRKSADNILVDHRNEKSEAEKAEPDNTTYATRFSSLFRGFGSSGTTNATSNKSKKRTSMKWTAPNEQRPRSVAAAKPAKQGSASKNEVTPWEDDAADAIAGNLAELGLLGLVPEKKNRWAEPESSFMDFD